MSMVDFYQTDLDTQNKDNSTFPCSYNVGVPRLRLCTVAFLRNLEPPQERFSLEPPLPNGPVESRQQQQAALLLYLLVPVVCVQSQFYLPTDCDDIQQHDSASPSGVYTIFPGGPTSPVHVYCDMDTDGGAWTVIQRRMDGTVNFNRPWDHYKNGFGNVAGEYWLGLDNIFLLTMREKRELRVDVEDWNGGKVYDQYSTFSIDPETFGYQLRLGSYINGGAGNRLIHHNNMKFTTYDKDQDTWSSNCAQRNLGGFWYYNCEAVNPNALYTANAGNSRGETRLYWQSSGTFLKSISMKIRPVPNTVAVDEQQE